MMNIDMSSDRDSHAQNGNDSDQSSADHDQPDYNFKVILVGNKRVGKTSITQRWVFEEFDEYTQSSRVVHVTPKVIQIENTEKKACLHVWDTLGQEKFMSLAPLFFRRSVGAFLVYDVSSMESFKAIDKWY